jgi:hypothetical protein
MRVHFGLLCLLATGTCAQAVTVLETESAWAGAFSINTSTGSTPVLIGQTFQVPLSGDTVFAQGNFNVRSAVTKSVTLGLAPYNPGTGLTSASILSGSQTVTGSGFFQTLTLDPVDTALTPGGYYFFYMSVVLTPNSFDIGRTAGTAYVPGRYGVGYSIPGGLSTYPAEDTAFRVELVPEPMSMAAVGLGLTVLARRKRK